jgi:hypothetical protein
MSSHSAVYPPAFTGLRLQDRLFSIETCYNHFKEYAMQVHRWGGVLALAATWVFSACGGSSSPATVTVSGVAATGAAIASGAVTLKCASGASYTTSTGSDGKFSVNVSGVALPCLAQVSYVDGAGATQKLRSIVTAAGNANITPVTELVVANLTGGTAATAFDNFNATTVKGYTAANIATAVAAVKTYISGLGVSVSSFPTDPIGTAFVPARTGVTGDAVDAMLDAFKAKLGSTTLDQAVAAVVASSTSSSSGSTSSGQTPSVGTLTVSNASLASRNGDYAPKGAVFTGTGETGFNGSTSDNKFELEVVWASNATIKRAHLWFYDTSGVPKFFGCDGGAIPCTGVIYEPLMKQVWFTNVAWKEVTPDLTGAKPDAAVSGGETLTVNATLDAK